MKLIDSVIDDVNMKKAMKINKERDGGREKDMIILIDCMIELDRLLLGSLKDSLNFIWKSLSVPSSMTQYRTILFWYNVFVKCQLDIKLLLILGTQNKICNPF